MAELAAHLHHVLSLGPGQGIGKCIYTVVGVDVVDGAGAIHQRGEAVDGHLREAHGVIAFGVGALEADGLHRVGAGQGRYALFFLAVNEVIGLVADREDID